MSNSARGTSANLHAVYLATSHFQATCKPIKVLATISYVEKDLFTPYLIT